jgi:hypothetical protein
MGKPLPPVMGGRKKPSTSTSPSSPAPAGGNSTASQSGSKGVPKWIMPLGIVYLVIRGLTIIAKFNIVFWDWIIILGLAVVAIINLLSGKQKFISLITIVVIGCILWFNGHNIQSNTTDQSTQQEQAAPAPVEETISTERVVVSGRKITLTGDGTYTVQYGKKSLCFENLGMKDGSSKTSQYLTIDGIEYSALGTKCHALDDTLNGEIIVDFFPGKDYGSKEGVEKLYNYWRSQPGGQAEWPIIRIGE